MRIFSWLLAALFLVGAGPHRDVTGMWQAVVHWPGGTSRRVMLIAKHAGTYKVIIHSLDESDVPIVTNNVNVNGDDITMKFDMNVPPWLNYHRSYRAHLSQSASTLTGFWTIPGLKPIEVTYTRVARPAWPILEPKATMVQVEPGVHVEALDWGGTGRPMLLLAGAGNTGHDFFGIVRKLTPKYHVYSMTRRGFGNSSAPAFTAQNYSADRLGDDVVAVIDALHLDRPILVGHSIAGEELSDVGSRFPGKVSALVYLEAGYWYAFDAGVKPPEAVPNSGQPPIERALLDGMKSFKGPIHVPILAIFAYPKDDAHMPKPERTASNIQKRNAEEDAQIRAFARGLPNARVIRIAHADHYVYLSNEAQVIQDINSFAAGLSR